MPRVRELLWRYEPTVNAAMDLLIGPTDAEGELTVDQLEVAWEIEGDRLMSEYRGPAGTRPWAHWWFDLGEQQPADWAAETVRLGELGELGADELAALRERANEARLRIGTDSERISGGWRENGVSMDVRAVELFEAVLAAGEAQRP